MPDDVVALALIRHVRQTATCTVCSLPFRSPHLLPACLHTFCRQCILPKNCSDCETREASLSTVFCPLCSRESVVSSSAHGTEIAVKDYFASKLLESIGHLLGLKQYGGNYSHFCEFVKKLHDACECPVCQELCCQPRMLPCSHTFCQSCLNRSSTSTQTLSKCPLCRQLYSHPAKVFGALPTNRLLSRILDKLSEPEVHQLVSSLLNPDSVDRQRCQVMGVTELHGCLYVLQNKSKAIHVSLADKPFSMLNDVPLDGVTEPTDLTASTSDSCLYVTDVGDGGCIWRVQVEEWVTEGSLEYVELKLDRNASELERMTTESARAGTECAQGRDEVNDEEVAQLNGTDTDSAASVAENVTSVGETQPVSETRDEANKLPESLLRGIEQCKQTDANLQELLHVTRESVVAGAVNATNKTESESKTRVQRMNDDDAGEMIHSLLDRTGLMKKISQRGNSRPCVFEVSRHYCMKRWVEGVRASALSVGADGQVIVVTDNGHLVIYGIDGQLIVDHSLPEEVQRPRHAVLSSVSGTFIVSHSSVSGAMHRVSELIVDPITSSLQVSRSYGSSSSGRVHWPRHLAVTQHGWVFVADCGNDRVLLLDDRLRLRRVMLSSECDGVKQPWRLCFVPQTGFLAVGSVTGNVALYSVGGKTTTNN